MDYTQKGKIKKQDDRTWFSHFDIVSEEPWKKSFRWRLENFRYVDEQTITEMFNMSGGPFFFRFKLFPYGEAPLNTSAGKYLSLYLEMEETMLNADKPSCFISSDFVVVNHGEPSLSRRVCVSDRCEFGSKSLGCSELLRLDLIRNPQSAFLLKGTDLIINIDVQILDDNWRLKDLPSDKFASTSKAITEKDDGGQFYWNMQNYILFSQRFKDDGFLISHPFEVGDTYYSVALKVEKEHFDCKIKDYLRMYLVTDVTRVPDINSFVLKEMEVWNYKTESYDSVGSSYGRLGFETVWGSSYFLGTMRLMEMCKFEEFYVSATGTVKFILSFYCLKEEDFGASEGVDGNDIWKLGAKVASTSSKKKCFQMKYYTKYEWKLINLSKMVESIHKYPLLEPLKILSRHIHFDEYQTRCAFFPHGTLQYPDKVVLGVEGLNAVSIYEERDILVQFRLGIVNESCDKTLFKEQLVRLNRNFVTSFPFVSISTFYSESEGYFDDGRLELVFDIRQVKEEFVEKKLPKGRSNHERKLITWELENFLLWEGIRSEKQKYVCSKYFEVQGCRIQLAVAATSSRGTLTASLLPDPSLEVDANFVSIKYRIATTRKQILPGNLQWVDGLRNKFCRSPVSLEHVDDKCDKIVFYCEINECLKVALNDHSLKMHQ